MPANDPLDKATARLLEAIADRAVEKKAEHDTEATKVEKKTELELLVERYKLWLKLMGATIAFLVTAGSALYGYVQSYIGGRFREMEAEAAAMRERDEASKVLKQAATHVQAEHVSPETVKVLKQDVRETSETIDALVEYNRQSHEYLLEVVAPKHKPKKPPDLERAEAVLDAVEMAKREKARKEAAARARERDEHLDLGLR